jgi:hypothetical protein
LNSVATQVRKSVESAADIPCPGTFKLTHMQNIIISSGTASWNLPSWKSFILWKSKSCPCALTEHHATKAYWRSGDIASRILDFGARWR